MEGMETKAREKGTEYEMNKVISYVLIAVLIATSTLLNWQSVSASTIQDEKNKLNEIELQQDKLNDKKRDVTNKKEETNGDINKNLTKQEKVTNEIEKVNSKLAKTKSSIQGKEKEISDTNKEIEQLKNDIKELKERIKKREELLKERLRTIQQNGGDMRYIEVILGSQNFGDFVSRSSAVNTIMDQDKSIMEIHMAEKIEVEEKKKEVVSRKEALEEQKEELVSLKDQLNDQMVKKEELMAQLETEHADLEDHKASLDDQEATLLNQEDELHKAMEAAENQIARLQQMALEKARKEKAAREQAAKEKAAEQSKSNNLEQLSKSEVKGPSNANFIWPAAGSRVSNYGMRDHPILPISRLHAGVDIAGPLGTPIRASISGYAMPVNYAGAFGNHVIVAGTINGTDYTTLYAHMSRSAISGGRYVEQGEVIGYMGSTGLSTGSHLHFEVHVGQYRGNASSVNPANFLN